MVLPLWIFRGAALDIGFPSSGLTLILSIDRVAFVDVLKSGKIIVEDVERMHGVVDDEI